MSSISSGVPIRISASGQVYRIEGNLRGVLCSASSSGLITLYDSMDSTGAVGAPFANAVPVVAGAYLPIPASLVNGLYCTIGGTADVTFFIGS